jgi:hypothetical protein
VMQEVRVVASFPDENQMGGRHEPRHERAAVRGTRKRIRAHTEPAAVVRRLVVTPKFLDLDELEPAPLHAFQATCQKAG